MHLKLYNYWRSSASYRVRIALALKNLDYDYVPVAIKPGTNAQYTPDYRQRNPEARVPSLDVDGQFLTQSMAILEWLDETAPNPPLLPQAPWARAQVRALAQIIVADIQPLQNLAVTRELHALGVDDAGVNNWIRLWITRGLSAFEQQLAKGPAGIFCFGTTPTLADICLIPQCYAARRFGVSLDAFPTVLAIERHCLTLPAFKRAAPEAQPDAEVLL